MKYMMNNFKENFVENKVLVLIAFFLIILLGYIAIPTFSEYKVENPTFNIAIWDGTIADSYESGDGSVENPYVISDGSELAFFASQLEITNYEGKYFVLNNDLVLNKGIFSYKKNDGIKYVEDDIENIIIPNEENTIINVFQHLNGFKGNFDGNSHLIYGLYIDESISGQNALFTNLEGNVSNLYIKNSVIYGGNVVAGVASKTKNSVITNVSYDGYVISDEEIINEIITLEIEDIINDVINNELIDELNINNLNSIPGVIKEISLSGIYQTDNSDAVLKINDEIINTGKFKIIIGDKLQTNIPIVYQTNFASEFSLTDLEYVISYDYSNAAGIISIAENTSLKNVINKADVYAGVYASGIINTINGMTELKNVYNTGNIESSNASSGLISTINQNKENVTITNSYNDGNLISDNNAMIGNIENNTGTVALTNVFNTQDNFGINLIEMTNVYINNSYIVSDKYIKTGTSIGKFIQTTIEKLKNKEFVEKNLKYQEYVDGENIDDDVWVWTFDDELLPILYIDELNRTIANIYVKDYVWNTYKSELDTLKFADKLVFSVEEVNALNPIKEVYYYISNEKKSLTRGELNAISDWKSYDEIIEVSEEGFYVIYVKVVDYNSNDIYLNTDLLVIDLTGSSITISSSFTDDTWESFKTDLNNYYINTEISVDIQAEDLLSGIDKIYYYISDTILSKEEVESIEGWNEYTGSIFVNSKKTIIYVKVVDNCNYATYANSDLIILNGYILNSLLPGMNGNSSENPLYITENSSISLNFLYQDTDEYSGVTKHQIVSNVLLPINSKITLIDKVNNKVFTYITTDSDYGYNDCISEVCEAKYDFELFNEVGSTNKFQESDYTGIINENFVVIVDFVDAEINENIENISIYLKMDNGNTNEIRNTLLDSIKKFNIICENSHAYFTLTSTFDDVINYNENMKYTIDFSTKLNYRLFEDNKIFDTTNEDKIIGLSIKMVNSNGQIVSKRNLKNISFKVGNRKYSPSNDGIVRINLEKGISDITDNLIIQTYSDNNNDIEPGNYKFIISLYTAYDGINSNDFLSSIEIPVVVGINKYNSDNIFNVIMNSEDRIITSKENEFDFKFLITEKNENTNIKMSLYKKNSLSAYDQNYTIVNLGEYIVDNELEKCDENIYYVFNNNNDNYDNLKLKLNTSLFEKNGYMFVFELYDGEKLVGKINKKFIVK